MSRGVSAAFGIYICHYNFSLSFFWQRTDITGIAELIPIRPDPLVPTTDQIRAGTAARLGRIDAYHLASAQDAARKQSIARDAYEKGGEKAKAKREARIEARAEKERLKALAQAEGGDVGLFGAEAQHEQRNNVDVDLENDLISSIRKPVTALAALEGAGDVPPSMTACSSNIVNSTLSLYPQTVPSHPHFPSNLFSEPISTLPHPLFPFPQTARDHALLSTFSTLHERGYRIGLGPRFGGEYLVYPGDYLRYHAHFTTQILVRDEPIKPGEIVAWGRLGTGTKKAGLICCWDDEKRPTSEASESSKGETSASPQAQDNQLLDGDGLQRSQVRAGAVDDLHLEDWTLRGDVEEDIGEGAVEFYSLEWANFG